MFFGHGAEEWRQAARCGEWPLGFDDEPLTPQAVMSGIAMMLTSWPTPEAERSLPERSVADIDAELRIRLLERRLHDPGSDLAKRASNCLTVLEREVFDMALDRAIKGFDEVTP
jgi:hypothetical protein